MKKNKKTKTKDTKEAKRKIKERNFIIALLFLIIPKSNLQGLFILNDSFITMRVSGTGKQKIFYDKNCSKATFTRPNEVYINETNQSDINYEYNLNERDIIKLVWKEVIIECECMLYSCETIVEINFTNFDASNSIYMDKMFENCKSLKYLDLSGLNISNVK